MTASEGPAFFDSSTLLAILLDQPAAGHALRLWEAHRRRVASVLLEAECRTVLRRAERAGALTSPYGDVQADLEDAIATVRMYPVDRRVLSVLEVHPQLGGCKTLDALHLATAFTLRERAGTDLAVVTFDKAMAKVAADLGFAVLGAP